jgi:hypothetical protein
VQKQEEEVKQDKSREGKENEKVAKYNKRAVCRRT